MHDFTCEYSADVIGGCLPDHAQFINIRIKIRQQRIIQV